MSTKRDFNRVILMGHLGGDPEFKEFENGKCAYFSLALNKEWTDQSGETHKRGTWVDCRINGGGAEVIKKHMAKGRCLLVEGELVLDKWQTNEGGNREKLRVLVDKFYFVGGKPSEGSEEQEVVAGSSTPDLLDGMEFLR